MKSPIIKLTGAVIVLGLCMGCASFGRQKAGDLSPHLPVGIVTVVSNYNIYWDDEDPDAAELFKKTKDPEKTRASSADGLINDAEAILRQSLAGAGVTALVSKEQVTGSRAYANAKRKSQWKSKSMVIADGYEPVDYGDKKFAAALAEETGVKAGIYVVFDFSKSMATGIGKTGNFRVQLDMTVIIIDENGQTLYKKNRFVSSDERIRVTLRAFNRNELLDLFRSNIAEACYLFIQEFAALNSLVLGE
ncbi:hypothetical protein AGMMS49942_27070 [Spirochaetia bacterium]|nr:hypothetical protein AGMMS49942_27070 [Spirochaetia bacterium]